MRKNKVLMILVVVLLLAISIFTMTACSGYERHKAMNIEFEKVDDARLNSDYLEVKSEDSLALVENGESDFVIAYNGEYIRSMDRALHEFQDGIFKMTGAMLPIVDTPQAEHNIFVGDISETDVTKVENDGFAINIDDKNIAIRGITKEAHRHGIYYFMEEYLGMKFVSPDDTFIPHHDNIYLAKGANTHNPALPWRSAMAHEIGENYWSGKLLLSSVDIEKTDEEIIAEYENMCTPLERPHIQAYTLGRQRKDWIGWCHTMYNFVSPREYYEKHPEYFSYLGGKRVYNYRGGKAHLCLSNPDVYEIVEKKTFELIENNPDVKYIDFSANDNVFAEGCKCKECKALDKAAGGTGMGSLLPFVNKLARRVREVYPERDIYISTLAYFHTLKPPTNGIKAEDNVLIKLCSMPGDQGTSYLHPGNSKAHEFSKALTDWQNVASHFIIWDYVVNFKSLLTPFPNFAVQAENQQFYEDNNVYGVFHQGSREVMSENSIMRSYLLSKLMFEGSALDVSQELSEYMTAYYGPAADKVIEYFNVLHANLAKDASNLGLYDENMKHFYGYLSKGNLNHYLSIIEDAKKATADDAKYLERVEDIETNILAAMVTLPNISPKTRANYMARFDVLTKERGIEMATEMMTLDAFNNRVGLKSFINGCVLYAPLILIFFIGMIVGIVYLVKFLVRRTKSAKEALIEDENNSER